MFVLAHLSDLHLDGSIRNASRAERALRHLADLPRAADAVLITGDITEAGDPQDYLDANSAVTKLRERSPVLFCPGNHDARGPFARELLGLATPTDGPVNQTHTVAGVSFVLADSTVPGKSEGRFGEQTLDWLDETLTAAADQPVFLAMHHPPVPLGIPYMDRIRLQDADAFATVLALHQNVAAILCGHAHTAAAADFHGVPVRVAPGVKSTAMMPWEQPEGKVTNLDLPIALAYHLYTDTTLTTHYRSL
ncbi:metallophosphoesterase [Nocardia sp. NPDC051570]|uniref:metallophosphoesterase n=1 Tax=Nocardia sp. NPDC051570 TaxID=3364324 RepID=UPI0037B82DF2